MASTLKANRKYQHLYAITRYAPHADEKTPLDLRFTVTKVVTDAEYAQQEVNRLNELNKEKGYCYFFQITRFEEVPTSAQPISPMELGAPESASPLTTLPERLG
jgi:hypothetical protein